ncbi:tetratricopeptide repeat-containing sulfotransferase family protein [Sandarakinorhabdus limnophila]|uniref:tetratricopeptide repeat-containing sulfotransferase family protein n=1 Tax=Sandarakinorhabdus limnophila TaxID=210512 RepID=UPI0026EA594F|nr:tetratricopeptide repeat-containing sulfotransferase family protein [Sandarakinorhabdus limnophila]
MQSGSTRSQPMGTGAATAESALATATAQLETDPVAALAAAEALLASAPDLLPADFLAGQALRRLGQLEAAVARLSALAALAPTVPGVRWELALAAAAAGQPETAITALEQLTRQLPAVAGGWFLLASQYRAVGRARNGWLADLKGVNAATQDPELVQAALAMHQGKLDAALALLVALPDPPARRLVAEIRWRQGDMPGAIAGLEAVLAQAPGYDMAREFLIRLLVQSNRLPDALGHAETLATSPVDNPGHDLILASVLVHLGEQGRARGLYEGLLACNPGQPQVWQNLGHVLKTLGEQAGAVSAYREAVTRQPTLGEAWWSLANLKTVKLGAAEIAALQAALATLAGTAEPRAEDLFHLHFALGKAHEDLGEAEAAFRHYAEGNRLRRAGIVHDADAFSAEIDATVSTFTAPFLAVRRDGGCPAPDPIFIVGLPRSGSTLIEQILASHTQVEGTMELPDMMMIASRLAARVEAGEFADFGAMMAALTPADRQRLGEEYLERTRIHRKSGKPRFIDKMPNNWQHVGLIRLILPNATIIDARRHPMGCCFSAWKQHFARGQGFSYDLIDVGRYYRDYVRLMAHFDAATPGAAIRVIYEEMVADTETQVRRLLSAVGLAYEPTCLEFWRNDRAVRTASSEQVRQPIFTDGVDHWKAYAGWLGPLSETLGNVATLYPAVPPDLAPI